MLLSQQFEHISQTCKNRTNDKQKTANVQGKAQVGFLMNKQE